MSHDPQIDPSVRVNFGRLRQNIADYYENDGKFDPVKIEIPKGTYRPLFLPNDYVAGKIKDALQIPTWLFAQPLLTMLVMLLSSVAMYVIVSYPSSVESPPDTGLAKAITLTIGKTSRRSIDGIEQAKLDEYIQELRAAFSRNKSLKIISLPDLSINTDGAETTGLPANLAVIDYSIKVMVRQSLEDPRLLVELINAHTNELVWARAYTLTEDDQLIVTKVTRELYSQVFGASQKSLAGRDPATLSARQLYVMSTWFSGPTHSTLAWEKDRLKFARMAIQKDPEFGPAYSVVADKLASLANIDGPSDNEKASEEASLSRTKALELSPDDGLSVLNVAVSYWHSGHLKDAVRTIQRALDLDPNNALANYFIIAMPYTCVVAPDDVVNKATEYDASLGKDNPLRWITLSSLAGLHMNRGELQLALEVEEKAAQIFQTAFTIMRRVALLNQLGRKDEAIKLFTDQKTNWPTLNARHFSERTMPRICRDTGLPEITQKCYDDLTIAMEQLS